MSVVGKNKGGGGGGGSLAETVGYRQVGRTAPGHES